MVVKRSDPKNEGFGLTSQIRRATLLIPSNIPEGYKIKITPEKTSTCALESWTFFSQVNTTISFMNIRYGDL